MSFVKCSETDITRRLRVAGGNLHIEAAVEIERLRGVINDDLDTLEKIEDAARIIMDLAQTGQSE